jgi:energy-coupling factor transporter ATP-binding protein EcfA2
VLLQKVHVQRFRNIVDSGRVDIEPDVAALVGKNESGKSTLLHALFRLNPANAGYPRRFDSTEEYPRWRLTTDRRVGDLSRVAPISAVFELEGGELADLAHALGVPSLPMGTTIQSLRTYGNDWTVSLRLTPDQAVRAAADAVGAQVDDIAELAGDSLMDIGKSAKDSAAGLEEKGEVARATALKKLPAQLKHYEQLVNGPLAEEQLKAIATRLPKFFSSPTTQPCPATSTSPNCSQSWLRRQT